MQDLGCIKGLVFSEFLDWYSREWNEHEVRAVVQSLQRRFPETFVLGRPGFGILASRWYRAEIVHALLDELTRGKPEFMLQKIAATAAADIMNRTISGIYRSVFALVVTPERYLKHVDKIWKLNYDSGRPVVVQDGKTHRIQYEGWRSHHPMICRLNMAAGKTIYEAMGCKDVTSRRLACVSEGAKTCENLVTWR